MIKSLVVVIRIFPPCSMTQPQSKIITQSKEAQLKTYQKRMKDDIGAMYDNFLEIIRMARMEDDSSSQVTRASQASQDRYEIEVRAANMVRAAESLMKLISDMKQFLVLNDFPHVNDSIMQHSNFCRQMQNKIDATLLLLRDDMSNELFEMEEEYYSSQYK